MVESMLMEMCFKFINNLIINKAVECDFFSH
jgi:hypothetical protein